MTKKKAKLPSITSLKKKLWSACSLFIRTRDKYTCFTCGRKGTGSAIHAGHFIPSMICNLELRYDPRNIHAQCFNCNINLGGNGAIYYRRMADQYGMEVVDDLFDLLYEDCVWTREDYAIKTLFYEKALEMIKQ